MQQARIYDNGNAMMQYLFGDYYQEFKDFITFISQELNFIIYFPKNKKRKIFDVVPTPRTSNR